MEATLGTLEQYPSSNSRRLANFPIAVGNWITGIFGCAHKQMSRPFSRHGESYRVCIACGARRQFDNKTWNSGGRFYYKPANTAELRDIDCTALRSL
ncbi:MAG TPA: hypothetical protein VJU86_13090 [Pyrinomonadaceae bacterium]|nr:hypothetical protein [Pyrinomonadaceae bacterium]